MATIYNSDLTKELTEAGKLQTMRDRIPNEFADKVVPVVNVNPKDYRVCNLVVRGTKSTTGDLTILTTSTDRDTYLVGATLAFAKDVTCDAATGNLSITAVINGQTIYLFSVPIITLTADARVVSFNLVNPIKIDRGTNIISTGTFTAGTLVRTSNLFGYTVENVKA